MPSTDDQPEEVAATSAQLAKVGYYVFNLFCEAHETKEENRHLVRPAAFIAWIGKQVNVAALPSADELAEDAGVPESSAVILLEASNGVSQAIAAVFSVWPFICLSHRENQYNLVSMNMLLVLQWEDGRFARLSRFGHRDAMGSSPRDAELVSLLNVNCEQMTNEVGAMGLDVIHDKLGNPNGDIFSSDVLKFFRDLIWDARKRFTTEEMADPDGLFNRTCRLLNWLVDLTLPVVPPEVLAKLRAAVPPGTEGPTTVGEYGK